MKIIENYKAIHLLICLIILFLFSCTKDEKNNYQIKNLSGTWKIIDSDSNKMSDPNYDDSHAETITIPGNWNHLIEKNDDLAATVWLRKKFFIENEFSDILFVLSLGSIPFADETYFNGVCIGRTGGFPRDKNKLQYGFAWHKERNYHISSKIIKNNSENTIAIKIFSHYINGIKDNPELYTITSWNNRNRLKDYLLSYSNFNPLLIFIILIIFLIITARINNRKNLQLYSLLIIIGSILFNYWMLGLPKISDGLFRYKILLSIWVFLNFFLYLQVQAFFNIIYKRITIIYTILFIIINISIILAPTTKFLLRYCGITIFILNILCNVLFIHYIFIKALLKDPKRYWYLLFPTLFLDLTNSINYYYQITNQDYKHSFLIVVQLPLLIFCAMFYYLFNLKDIEKENDSLTQALLKKSQELKKISKALSKNELKPEPRDIIYDLIDYLDNNFTEAYDRKKLAEKFGLNEFYMGQIFKKVTNTNIANYINIKRIESAKQLIEETDSKIIDIAFHVGFDNLTYFYRHFRKQMGLAPNEYKKSLKK